MKRNFFYGFSVGILLVTACAGIQYHYYGIQMPTECFNQLTLLGKQTVPGWPDLPGSNCKPDDQIRGKCWVELTEDHFRKEQELEQCRDALSKCQNP